MEVEILNLVGGLERLGFHQSLFCLQDRGELAGNLPPSLPVWSHADAGGRRHVTLELARSIRRWRPDVVHVRNGWAWPDATLAWLMSLRVGRLVFSFHGWDRVGRLPRRRAFIYRLLARLTPALATISGETAEKFADEAGIDLERFTILESGIDVTFYRPAEPGPTRTRLVLGCVGRLDPIKAHDELIAAFAEALADGRRDLELRIIGDGPARGDLERQVADLGLTGRVLFMGMRRDIAAQLRELDIFVLSSRREGRPVSIMEAMACGLPVIATDVGSVAGLIEPGRTGLLVQSGDRPALTRTIASLTDDAAARVRMGEEARKFAVDRLSVNRMAEQYATFYRNLIRTS